MLINKSLRSVFCMLMAGSFSVASLAKGPQPSVPVTTATTKSLAAAPFKVAIVDMQAAILQTDEGIQARASIQKDGESKRKDLMSQQKGLEELEKEFIAQQAVLTEEVKANKHEVFRKKVEAFRVAQVSFEQEMRQKESEATQKITRNLVEIITEISKKNDYGLVFEKGAGVLLYASEVTDITPLVVKEYNNRHKPLKTAEAKKAKAQ